MPFIYQEFNSMDENMTGQLVQVQQQALNLAMLVQKIEDEQNAAMGGHAGKDSISLSLSLSLSLLISFSLSLFFSLSLSHTHTLSLSLTL
jgi:hypothetical protein